MLFLPDVLSAKRIEVIVAGAGGTGSHLIPNLAKLLRIYSIRQNKDFTLTIIDRDRVEPKNIGRQNFKPQHVGQSKAAVMAQEAAQTGIKTKAIPEDLEKITIVTDFTTRKIVIACLDSPESRYILSKKFPAETLLIDCGNDKNSGQVLVGNIGITDEKKIQKPMTNLLPDPYFAFPQLIDPASKEPEDELPCSDRIDLGYQQITANVMTATLALTLLDQILSGTCTVAGYRFYNGISTPVRIEEVLKETRKQNKILRNLKRRQVA